MKKLKNLVPYAKDVGYNLAEHHCEKLYGSSDPMVKSRLDGPKFKNRFKKDWVN